ncbi:MAG: type II toxin-antitoxin system VapC family toxin [Burkholderiales bacterium]
MAFVAGNSVVLAWFVKSQSTAYSERMLGRVAREPVHVPVVWALEFSNALRQLERRRKIKPAATESILDGVDALALRADSSLPSERRLLDLAR